MKYLVASIAAVCTIHANAFCFEQAGTEHNVNPQLLRAIAQVESALNHKAINESHIQRTKTIDIGLMQINSSNLSALAKDGVTQEKLLDDPCLNVRIGARILAEKFKKEGANWDGVGAYNAACVQLKGEECQRARNNYTTKVWQAMNRGQNQMANQINTKDEVVRLSWADKGRAQQTQASRIASVDVASSEPKHNIE